MSYPHQHFYALNEQGGHQLFYDQVLEAYPIETEKDFLPGGYQADGTVLTFGKNCAIRTIDQYGMPTACSTWASGGNVSSTAAADCCAPGSIAKAEAQQAIPGPFFPVTFENEVAAATK